MNQYKKAIKIIIDFKKRFTKINPKIPKKLVGVLGEFYVLQRLHEMRFNPKHKGGQSGYDIYLKEIDKRIEVKTSLWKNEGVYSDKNILFWGWTVEKRDQKIKRKFDYLICVGLNDDFSKPKFYIFTYKEAFSVDDILLKKFNNVKKKIHLFKNKRFLQSAIKSESKIVTKVERSINRNQSLFLNNWKKIKS